MTLEELYREYPLGTKLGDEAQRIIFQTNWFLNALEFDPVTGEALPMALSEFLTRILRDAPDDGLHDRLWKIVNYSEESFRRIVRALNEQPRTEHSRMHISRVREMDASSFMKLANRTGRTIREKLSANPYVTSVRHFQSIDLAENRLLKAYAIRLEELLSEREKAFDRPEPFLVDIRKWLRTEEAKSISRWNNIPPNNVLLAHRDYRRIWNAWRWLQTLDDDIERDRQVIQRRQRTMDFWNRAAYFFSCSSTLMADIPLRFDFDKFTVQTFQGLNLNFFFGKNYSVAMDDLAHMPPGGASSSSVEPEVESGAVCIDLFPLEPVLASGRGTKKFGQKLIWQKWDRDDDSLDIMPLQTKGVWQNESALTVTAEDLFIAGEKCASVLGSAARSFCSAVKRRVPVASIAWLVPDCANDFDLGELRRAVNSHYREAMAVPRSIAKVYQQLGRDIRNGKIGAGASVAVIDMVGNRVVATRLVAQEWTDGELKERVPESGGLFWVRQPIIELGQERGEKFSQLTAVATLDSQRRWVRPQEDLVAKERIAIMQRCAHDPRIAHDKIIIIEGSPVDGGLKFYQCQKKAGNIPLWKDILPDLSIGAPSSTGVIAKVALVSATTQDRDIIPLPGAERLIRVDDHEVVWLPAGKRSYQFKIFQGAGAGQLRYCAVVACSQVFPYPQNIRCKLELKYTYGANDPYTLHLKPMDDLLGLPDHFDVEWKLISADEVDLDSVARPGFPKTSAWADFKHFKAKYGESDLIEQLWLGVDRLEQYLKFVRNEPSNRKTQAFTGDVNWQTDQRGRSYFNANVNGCAVTFYEDRFKDLPDNLEEISFDVEPRGRYYVANNVSVGHSLPDRPQWLRSQIRFPMSVMFAVCRDDEMPPRLEKTIARGLETASALLGESDVPRAIADEALLFLSYFPELTSIQIEPLLRAVVAGNPYRFASCRKAVGVSLCGLGRQWQADIYEKLIAQLGRDLKWTSSALEVLSIALWRDERLALHLQGEQIRKIAAQVNPAIRDDKERIASAKNAKGKPWELKSTVNTLRSHLELMLALLRARGSADEAIKKMLVPNGSISQTFDQTIDDHVMPLVAERVQMASNIELNVVKPSNYRNTPDLIYALKMYLTGDSGADSIIIERNAGGE